MERSSHLKKKLYPLAGGRGEPNRLFAKLPRGSVPLEKPLCAGMCRSHRFGCRRTLRPFVSGARCASRGHVFSVVALSGRTPRGRELEARRAAQEELVTLTLGPVQNR